MYTYMYMYIQTASPEGEPTRSWLINSSYQPLPEPPVPTPEDLAPPAKRNKDTTGHKEKERKKETVKQQSSSVTGPKPKTNWLDDCGLAPQEAHRLDSSSDHANLQYNALYSGDIAAYRRRFGGRCLGLGPHQSFEWTDNRGTKHARKHREKVTRYFTTSLPQNDSCLYLGPSTDVKVTTQRHSHAPFFMALDSAASVCRESGEEEKTDGVSRELTSEVFVSQQTAKYNRGLQEDPRNVSLWLEFLEFQPALRVSGGREGGGGQGPTSKALRAVNERKLAIFERALEHNPTAEHLLVGHLELLREVGREPDVLLKKWRDLLFRMPNKPLLWLKYTEFCRMQFSTFSLSSITSLYQKSFTTLTVILEGVMKSHSPEPNTPEHLLALFAQFCHCLCAAGQNERAIACYQALIEYNLCSPSDISLTGNHTNKQKVEFFEPFWDSGAPRLGEDGAVGWSNWMQASQSQQAAKPLSVIDAHFLAHSKVSTVGVSEECDPELSLVSGHTLSEAWLHLESYRQQMDSLPFRGSEDELSDPERAVLFEDIGQCLFTVSAKRLQLKLILQYLRFLGVVGSSGAPCLDSLPHLISPHLHCALDALPTVPHHAASSFSVLHPHNYCGVSSRYGPLSTADLLRPLSEVGHPPPSHGMCRFISNTCNQLLSLLLPHPDMQTAVALEWIQFELSLLLPALQHPTQSKSKDTRRKAKAVQKLVKALLKLEAHRNNLSLWDSCAQLELLLAGNSEEAETIYKTVLSQYTVITPQLLPLYQHYCEVLMGLAAPISPSSPLPTQQQSAPRALQLTVCVAEGKYSNSCSAVPPSNVLRARYVYEQKPTPEKTCSYIICHAYLEYLSRGVGLACKVFDDHLSSVKLNASPAHSTSQEQRAILVDLRCVNYQQVRLLVHHTQSRPMPPALLLNTLESALTRFPDNPYFLSVYADSQQPLYLMGKLRKYFDTHAPRAETALPWVHAVRAEVARYRRVQEGEMEGSTDVPAGLVNRIRALLNRATQSVNGRGCPLLWRLAMSFEVYTVYIQCTMYIHVGSIVYRHMQTPYCTCTLYV